MVQLRREWQQTLSRKQALVAIAVVVALLSGMGIVFLVTGGTPAIPPLGFGLLLVFVLGRCTWVFVKQGKRAFSALSVFHLLGVVLFVGGNLLPKTSVWHDRAVNVGCVLVGIALVFSIIEPRQAKARDEEG